MPTAKATVTTNIGSVIRVNSANAIRGIVAREITIAKGHWPWYLENKAVIDECFSCNEDPTPKVKKEE